MLRSVSPDAEKRDSDARDSETTAQLPQPPAPTGAADETAVLPPVSATEETAVLPPVPSGAADETAVLPPVGAADETAVLPPVRDHGPSDRVPAGYFRDERSGDRPEGGEDRTRELPQVDEQGTPGAGRAPTGPRRLRWTTCPPWPTNCSARARTATTTTTPGAGGVVDGGGGADVWAGAGLTGSGYTGCGTDGEGRVGLMVVGA